MKRELNQWHPALYASMQIEFEEECDKLIFENEHQISKKPLAMDVLIIKKEKDAQNPKRRTGNLRGFAGAGNLLSGRRQYSDAVDYCKGIIEGEKFVAELSAR